MSTKRLLNLTAIKQCQITSPTFTWSDGRRLSTLMMIQWYGYLLDTSIFSAMIVFLGRQVSLLLQWKIYLITLGSICHVVCDIDMFYTSLILIMIYGCIHNALFRCSTRQSMLFITIGIMFYELLLLIRESTNTNQALWNEQALLMSLTQWDRVTHVGVSTKKHH